MNILTTAMKQIKQATNASNIGAKIANNITERARMREWFMAEL